MSVDVIDPVDPGNFREGFSELEWGMRMRSRLADRGVYMEVIYELFPTSLHDTVYVCTLYVHVLTPKT